MILSFTKKFPWGGLTYFESKILTGTKKHTIRRDKNDRWKPGNKIHFSTGLRTADYNQFAEGECTKVEPFQIEYAKNEIGIWVRINGKSLSTNEVMKLAVNDGFQELHQFFLFFDRDFKGKIIHWDPKGVTPV
jgi:uncharacterized protein YqfB (UPF0267 family)